MSRLTIRNGMFIEDGTRIQDLEGYHTSSSDANRFAKKEIYKLGQLEDVLEEFGIESAEVLRLLLNGKEKMKTMSIKGVEKLKLKNRQLKEQLAVKDKALKMASKEAWGNKASFVNSDYGKKITNAEEYSKFFIFEAEKELKELEGENEK